jgi:exopolysaccharide biosynthesis predicted pyruvyltransferase EpsI
MRQFLKKMILKNKISSTIALTARKYFLDAKLYYSTKPRLKLSERNTRVIFYLGIPAHSNLGDLAQGVCIRHWLKKNYPDTPVVEIETNALVNTQFSLLKNLQAAYRKGDIIVFQSGYTTTDLGGYADEMHQAVMNILPEAKMLMMPQTIFFKSKENEKRTSRCYNSIKNMLFLARDRISYNMALEMFPDLPVKQFPDIVTTLIGNYSFIYKREGILFCCRNDSEKYYSNEEINKLMNKCHKLCKVDKTDTTKPGRTSDILKNAEEYIKREIDTYAHYELIITDRYHGTILSLVAGTPVIIIKTTDHKVTTGAEWFHGVYDDYVYVAGSLEDAYILVEQILRKPLDHNLQPYFEKEYYDKLPVIFEQALKG